MIPQATSDIHNPVGVTNEILGSQFRMLSIHAIGQSMIGQGHGKYVVASVEESGGDLLEGSWAPPGLKLTSVAILLSTRCPASA
jgi:hypothetical protein